MIVLGLTGSIAMGKTRTGKNLERLGVPVFDSDIVSRRITSTGGDVVAEVKESFPGAVRKGQVDRNRLAQLVFGDANELKRLETIIHPRVAAARRSWLRRMALARKPVVALDIPLLFETGSERFCDLVIVVSAPRFLQYQRVLRRPGMDGPRLADVLARQIPDYEKRRRADVVVRTGLGHRFSLLALSKALRQVGVRHGKRNER